MKDNLIKISHPALSGIENIKTEGNCKIQHGIIESYFEESVKKNIFVLNIDFGIEKNFNSFSMDFHENHRDLFPDTFRIEISDDGIIWEPLIQEVAFSQSGKKSARWHFPLIQAKYIKIVAKGAKVGNGHAVAYANAKATIAGVVKIDVSSEGDRLWVKENLIDTRPDYGWSSRLKEQPGEEFIRFDLGSINRVEELRILSKKEDPVFFPENFIVYYSEDDITWNQLIEEPRFFSEGGTWYKWRFLPVNMRFMKLVSHEQKVAGRNKYATQIVEIELYASTDLIQSSEKVYTPTVPYASVLRSGLVRLAVDGEAKEGLALQSNDRRLRDATIEYKGIVEFASDGEDRANVAVQGNDKRLKTATEATQGLVRLAKNGESKPGLVVQADDERLKIATSQSAGIVELAESGETRPGVVVQGNDERLRKATTNYYGLAILSENGGEKPGFVVTADDRRLKDATTERMGIVRLAGNGEESSLSVVQGNDKRLKKATTEESGIMQFARSGEEAANRAVQANDIRLKKAEPDKAGIVEVARHGSEMPGQVVQADDPRLKDARIPIPHQHDYAPLLHDYNSHTGFIKIEGEAGNEYTGTVPPPVSNGIVFAKNNGNGSGAIGIGKKTGLSGFGGKEGVIGVSDNGNGVLGISDHGFGGTFLSAENFALHAQGRVNSGNFKTSGKAILSEGESVFKGSLYIQDVNGADCMARYFNADPAEIIEPGDLVAINEEGRVIKSRTSYSTRIVGVAVHTSGLILGKNKEENHILVAVAGVVAVNADASEIAISPGDLLVSGLTGGFAIRARVDQLKVGTLVGKSLVELKSGRGKVFLLLSMA